MPPTRPSVGRGPTACARRAVTRDRSPRDQRSGASRCDRLHHGADRGDPEQGSSPPCPCACINDPRTRPLRAHLRPASTPSCPLRPIGAKALSPSFPDGEPCCACAEPCLQTASCRAAGCCTPDARFPQPAPPCPRGGFYSFRTWWPYVHHTDDLFHARCTDLMGVDRCAAPGGLCVDSRGHPPAGTFGSHPTRCVCTSSWIAMRGQTRGPWVPHRPRHAVADLAEILDLRRSVRTSFPGREARGRAATGFGRPGSRPGFWGGGGTLDPLGTSTRLHG